MTDRKIKLIIDIEKCKGCKLCVPVCPQKSLGLSEHVNEKGHRYVVLELPEKCTGCGLCVTMCPDCAIEIIGEDAGGEKSKK